MIERTMFTKDFHLYLTLVSWAVCGVGSQLVSIDVPRNDPTWNNNLPLFFFNSWKHPPSPASLQTTPPPTIPYLVGKWMPKLA